MITIENFTPGHEPQEMKKSEMFMTLISGVGLPSWDVYSDIAMSAMLINSGHPRAIVFGWAMQVPVVLSTIFQIPHWWKIERNMKRRICIYFAFTVTSVLATKSNVTIDFLGLEK